MAVVGLHNVSAFGPSLQMWRELEGENVVNQSYRSRQRTNGSDSECSNTPRSTGPGSENGDDDNHSVVSEDLGENERERVRKIFQEWLGEIGSRRPIRRLCGRQTLLDLLLRAESERKRELQGLSEQKPVTEFAHRNRIQALLRGRFLRNDERLVLEKRPSSVAATELGLLRQRQTVSDLREGFLSKLDNYASFSSNNSDSSSSDENNEESESTSMEDDEVSPIHTESNLENTVDTNPEPEPHEPEAQAPPEAENPPALNIEQEEPAHIEEAVELNHSAPLYVHDIEDGQRTVDLEENTNEEFEQQDSSWQQLNNDAFAEWPENIVEEDQEQIQETHDDDWPSHDLQEAIDSWLDMPSGDVSSSLGRIDTFYFHDDDNNHSIELQELFSRRRVSSLLRSSFRASLDQVLQSHAERLSHANVDWEMDNSSAPASIEQDQQQLDEDQRSELSDGAERDPFDPSSTLFTTNQPLWGEELHDESWQHHNSNQQFGTEWDIINELRIDMARLQQRMNNMQSMLETCMEMQFELQRSVRQELSAALNRSGDESHKCCNRIDDESKWDDIRKGTCCLCRDSNIDSLLYRCGHMCTCTKCAEDLVQCMGKCPMCEAPVVEAVRAYFVQS